MKIESNRPDWRTRIKERWRAAYQGVHRGSIRFNDDGFYLTTLQRDGSWQTTHVRWDEINGAVAYKRDIFSMDLLCIGFSTPDGGVEVSEHMDGWHALTQALPIHLPGTPKVEAWWEKVVQPPFAANPTILFSLK